MTPDSARHNPDPQYLRELIDQAGLSQRGIARLLGLHERTFRQYITSRENATYLECPYPVQFALEVLARAK